MTEITCPECGSIFSPKAKGKPRSLPEHKRFFAIVAGYFTHWPESCEFQPETSEHLRAWALVKAHHFDSAIIDPDAILKFASLRIQGEHSFVVPKGGKIHVYWPKSISFKACEQWRAHQIFSEAEGVLEAEAGITSDDLLEAIRTAA